MRDPSNDGRKCNFNDQRYRVFDLRSGQATESKCKDKCSNDSKCVAFSAIFNSWCIGCSLALEDSFNQNHGGAIAYRKGMAY